MARVEKYSRAAIGNLLAHMERRQKLNKKTDRMEYVQFGNREIDTRWSPLNWRIWPPLPEEITEPRDIYVSQQLQDYFDATGQDSEETALDRFRRIFRNTPHAKRKDLKCVCDWCISLPDEIPCDRMGEFFDLCSRYCIRKYGAENIIGIWVHVDEDHRPHMDCLFVPVATTTTTNEDGSSDTTKRICAKDVLNQKHLAGWHGGLTAYLQERMGVENPGILNGRTKAQGGNRTVEQMKAHDKHYAKTKGKEVDTWRRQAEKRLQEAVRAAKQKPLDNFLVSAKERESAQLRPPRERTLMEKLKGR